MLTTWIWLLASRCHLIYLCFFSFSGLLQPSKVVSCSIQYLSPQPEHCFFTLSAFHHPGTFSGGQHKFLSFNLSPSQLSMFFSISWSFHFGQQVLQKCTCESLLLFPYTLLIQPHSEHFHDIPLTFYSHIGTKLCLVYKSAFLLCSSLAFLQFP